MLFFIVLIFSSLNCQNSDSERIQNNKQNENISTNVKVEDRKIDNQETQNFVDVPKMANKSAAEFDKVFGKPLEITEIKDNPAMMPGEYRLYKMTEHPKGLSVRFYKDAAKRFNLLLGTPQNSSKDALSKYFRINVGEISPDKKSEPLSEKWKGNFNGINFITVYAKRENVNSDFTMVHAEVVK